MEINTQEKEYDVLEMKMEKMYLLYMDIYIALLTT